MNRDQKLIQLILLEVQNGPAGGYPGSDHLRIPNYTAEQIAYHVQFAIEEGILTGVPTTVHESKYPAYIALRVTPAGRNLIEPIT